MTKRDESANCPTDARVQDSANTVLILADWEQAAPGFSPSLARVATLPLLLRNVLIARASKADSIVICAPTESADHMRQVLSRTGRMPAVEWLDMADPDLTPIVATVARNSRKVVLVLASRSYQPQLLTEAVAAAPCASLEVTSGSELVGICVLSGSTAQAIGSSGVRIRTLRQLHSWLEEKTCPETKEVPAQSWQRVAKASDVHVAEQKMEAWLIKPTDGIFARMNRRVSIPISRQLIKFPITPNMVSLFVLGVSLACGYFYAVGGYWGCLVAALLAVAGSILDGCDGEVARFKLQSTPFGCWVDTVCDYLYYIAAFGGMAISLGRDPGLKHSLAWGGLLLFGAVATFLAVSVSRQKLAGASPEKLLAIWQKKAESRSSNPLIYFGRQTEFIVRRCFHPYALVAFALFGATKVVFVGAALGANIAWVVALYSYYDFSRDLHACDPSGQTGVITPGASA